MDLFSSRLFPVLLPPLTGFCVGTLSGFYGVGGGWLITPVLNIFGLSMGTAIGTSLLHITVVSLFGSLRHWKMKNLDPRTGLLTGGPAVGGVYAGRALVIALEEAGRADTAIRVAYIVFLLGVGVYMMFERGARRDKIHKGLRLPGPAIEIPGEDGRPVKVPVILLMVIGLGVGFLSAAMGVGGGFVLLPLLIYAAGFPVGRAVGTSLFSVLIMGATGGAVYGIAGRLSWRVLLFMSGPGILGVYLGSAGAGRAHGEKTKKLFAYTLLAGACAVLFKQSGLDRVSSVFVITVMVISTVLIFIVSLRHK